MVWKISLREADGAITARGECRPNPCGLTVISPEAPILPGVAQLAMIVEILEETLGPDGGR